MVFGQAYEDVSHNWLDVFLKWVSPYALHAKISTQKRLSHIDLLDLDLDVKN